MNDFKTVVKTAWGVRCWAEKLRNQNSHDTWQRDLEGMCAICSIELFQRLRHKGVKLSIAVNNEHCFALYENRLIDVTATQFSSSFKKVEIKPWPGPIEHWWQAEKILTSFCQFKDEFRLWPKDQRPLSLPL